MIWLICVYSLCHVLAGVVLNGRVEVFMQKRKKKSMLEMTGNKTIIAVEN